MQNMGLKTYLLGGVTAAVVLGGFVYLHANLVDTMDRLEQAEARLQQVDKASRPVSTAPIPAAALDSAAFASAQDLDQLRTELVDLRKRLAAAPAPAEAKADVASVDKAAGAGTGNFSPEGVAAIKKLLEDTLEEREKGRRSQWSGMTEEFMKTRRKQSLDELEERLKLTAYQREQINTVAEEQGKIAAEVMASLWSGGSGIPGGGREDSRKKFTELETTTDTRVKQFLTAQQSVEYDKWKEDTGGWGGRMGRGGGAAIRVGGGGRTSVEISTDGAGQK